MGPFNGDIGDSKGILLENPRSTNPYGAWAVGDKRGFGGSFMTPGKFFISGKNSFYRYPCEKFFNGPNKSIKSPISPFQPPPGPICQRLSTAVPAPTTHTFK